MTDANGTGGTSLAAQTPVYDRELYGRGDQGNYVASIPVDDTEEEYLSERGQAMKNKLFATAPRTLDDDPDTGDAAASHFTGPKKIIDREDEYKRRRLNRVLSPTRADPFAQGDQTPLDNARTYKDVMAEHAVMREKDNTLVNIMQQKRDAQQNGDSDAQAAAPSGKPERKKRRWDQPAPGAPTADATPSLATWGATPGRLDAAAATPLDLGAHQVGATPSRWDATPSRWDATPQHAGPDATPVAGIDAATPGALDVTPGATPLGGGSRWGMTPGATPAMGVGGAGQKPRWDETPTYGGGSSSAVPIPPPVLGKQSSRWDETPAGLPTIPAATPALGTTPAYHTSMQTPAAGYMPAAAQPQAPQNIAAMTPDQVQQLRFDQEMYTRNRPLTDDDLDSMLPGPGEGYQIVTPPDEYIKQVQEKQVAGGGRLAAPTPTPETPMYQMPEEQSKAQFGQLAATPLAEGLPELKPEDMPYFSALASEADESLLSVEQQKQRKIMKLLLKVKNGNPQQRKGALRQLTDKARDFGAGPLFDQILPLLMSQNLEDQERHLLVKVIDRIMYKLDDLVRPYVHKILVVIEPLLIDEDYYARIEGREIIANLAKAAGLPSMIQAMRQDIDNKDEYCRNTTARAFSVVASALGIPALLPFLKAVCNSRKSWEARHTGIKIVQQIAILTGCAILPHLDKLVEIIAHGLEDENQKVKTITSLSIAALAEASAPYGIESFDKVLEPLWKGVGQLRGKILAAFLKAIGFIIPLMEGMDSHINYYTMSIMKVLKREFQTTDEEMKKIVLKVVKQCVSTEGVDSTLIREDVLPEYFKCFWQRRMALDRRNYKQLVETTVSIALKVGCSDVINRIVADTKDEKESFRRMVIECIDQIVQELGTADIDARLEELLVDGIIYAIQEQSSDDNTVVLHCFGTLLNSLETRSKPYLPQVCGLIKWRLNNTEPKIRQQAADLIAKMAQVMKQCGEDALLKDLARVLYENLGEEFPDVLGSILGALTAVVNVIGMLQMTPPIKELLPRLTPILKNRQEKVQENCIDLVGRIADRAADQISTQEWMRICFELLDLLNAHKKAIRRAAVNTFGYIAKAIGPQDVLVTLLNNLKVQERQNRVCTTVAIAIVAEICGPFTIIPGLMNEYRVPELNVQNGVLKALSFMFEYVGEVGKDYLYAVAPLLEDALMDRDVVHRQIACNVVMHAALGSPGLGVEDAFLHLMNYVWPNVFENSPHVINAVTGAIDAMRVALGPGVVLMYLMQGLWHPARKVRNVYWKLYNNLYIGSQEALVAVYPRLEDEGGNAYRREELDVFI